MKTKNLQWDVWTGHFTNSWQCIIPGFDVNYTIYNEPDTGKTVVSGVDRKKTKHDSVQKAKDWCQRDFNERIKNLLENES